MSMMLLFGGEVSPAYDLNFMGGIPPGLTYTNSSTTRTYFGSDGLLKTAAANEPIFEYDPTTLALLGMRWEMEQRTNLCTNSEFPGGTADSSIKSGLIAGVSLPNWLGRFTTGISFGYDGVTTSYIYMGSAIALTQHTFSVFVKMDDGNAPSFASATAPSAANDFVLIISGLVVSPLAYTVKNVGGGVYRVSATITSGIATLGNNGVGKYNTNSSRTFKVTGYHLEAGSSASSYIPTTTAAVIRQPDVLTATSISPWYNQSEGMAVFEGIVTDSTVASSGLFVFSDGTNNELIGGYVGLTASSFFCVDGGVAQADLTTMGTVTQNSVFRHVGAYKLNDFAGVLNAGTVRTDTSGTIATTNQLRFGGVNAAGANPFMGYARRFQYFNTRLPNAQIQGMSRV